MRAQFFSTGQFYSPAAAATGDLFEAWSEVASARLLAIAPDNIGIGTVRNMTVAVTVEIHEDEPDDDPYKMGSRGRSHP